MIEVVTPSFATMDEADEWLARMELFRQALEATHQQWTAEDQTIIGYTTRSMGGGGFASFRYRTANGSGFGPYEVMFVKQHSQRKAARARAVALYKKYAPIWSKRHPDFA